MEVEGSCHCGQVTYRATVDPDKASLCHCTDCQTLSGSGVDSRAESDVPDSHGDSADLRENRGQR